MTDITDLVRSHYNATGLTERIRAALATVAPESAILTPDQVQGLDQFHTRGLAATLDLAEAARLQPGEHVLDLGCGLGGPARALAARVGAIVTGIDLSVPFIEAGHYLNARCGLDDRVTLAVGDATQPPFDNGCFDAVFLQHVAMNIADRAALYAGIARVLRPGGRLATYDIVRGEGDLLFPVPWSRDPAASHLLSTEETLAAIVQSGLTIEMHRDDTQTALDWFANLTANGGPPPGPNLAIVIGPDFPLITGNLGRNLREGRARILTAIAAKPA